MEMQQTARIVMSQIADEVRMAGQGVPMYASTFDLSPSESTAAFLGSSSSSRIDFRAGLSNVETVVTTFPPLDIVIGSSTTLGIADSTGLSNGKYIYLWGPVTNGWAWIRAQLTSVASTYITFIPQQTGSQSTPVHFIAAPTVYLEEAVSIFLNAGSVRHATASGFANPASPTWGPSNEIGANFTDLTFTYYDVNGSVVTPTSLANRASIHQRSFDGHCSSVLTCIADRSKKCENTLRRVTSGCEWAFDSMRCVSEPLPAPPALPLYQVETPLLIRRGVTLALSEGESREAAGGRSHTPCKSFCYEKPCECKPDWAQPSSEVWSQ
jgi:hypothetical protein